MKLYKRGNVWWVTYGGKARKRISTHQSDHKKAEEYALKIIAPIHLDEDAALLERAAKLRNRAQDMRCALLSLDELFDVGKYCRLHGCKPNRGEAAGQYWRRFVDHCHGLNISTTDGLTREVFRDFIMGLRPRAAQVAIVFCRQILRDAGYDRDIYCKPPRHQSIHREPLTHGQIRDLLSAASCHGEEFSAFVRGLIYTGLRLGDAATLRSSMYNPRTGVICRTMAKTGHKVEFPLHPAMRPWFDSHCVCEYIFPAIAKQYLGSADVLKRRIARLFTASKISGEPGQYCAHCLRTTFASLCAENGVPLAVIQSWLGHTSSMVTRIYARIEDIQRKREALQRFPCLDEMTGED